MGFRKIAERLQNLEENEGFLILVRCGVFFTGIGKDAVILSEKLGITNVCFAEGICKSSIPVCRIEKILPRIISKDISVAIYEYNPKGIEYKNGEKYELLRRIVMSPVKEDRKCLECEKCIYYKSRIKTNIASTEEIVKGIDSILGEKYGVTKIEDNKKEGNKYGR